MIEFDDVRRCFGQRVAVDRLAFKVSPGEIFAFLGPNGAGKTTSIKMLVGLLLPTSGQIILDGLDIVKHPEDAKRRIGYVPDQPQLYDKLTGREFLHFITDMYGMEPAKAQQAIDKQAATFELSEYWDRLSEGYSNGMKQRVAFAAALVHQPGVLVLDEPMVGLDPRSMRLVKDLLQQYARQGTTVFMSTHTLAVAEEIADRIGVLDQGRLQFLGTVDQLREQLAIDHSSLEDLFLELTGEVRRDPSATP